MKKNKGITIFLIGMALSTLGMTMLSNYKIIQYAAMIIGLVIMIYSVVLIDKSKKNQKN